MYEVTVSTSARKELRDLSDPLLSRVLHAMRALAEDPRPHGCRKMSGARDRWRIRVGDYRVVYSIDDFAKAVTISRVRHRSAAYEWPPTARVDRALRQHVRRALVVLAVTQSDRRRGEAAARAS